MIGSDNQIANLSSRILTEDEITVLGLGLKFISSPSPRSMSYAVNHLIKDIEASFEKYIWPKSSVLTNAQNAVMAKVLRDIKSKIYSVEVVPPKQNFPQRLKNALLSLKEDPTIVIAKADKGDTVVVLDALHYYDLAAKHLADNGTYELLETDPIDEIVRRYHQYLKRCLEDGMLDDYQYHRLLVSHDYQMSTIYFLPKIHKHPLKLRPIVASCNSITSSASRYVDKILQPHMKQVRSYCKNATHIVRILSNTIAPPTSYLVSLDIESLYTNISFNMAIEVFLKIFAGHPKLILYLDLLKYVLNNNIFQFSGKIYHQVCGIAMGTTMAPALASVVVAYYEDMYLESRQLLPLVWRRYIDDILAVWPYSTGDFLDFFDGLNRVHPNLRFTMEISYLSIQFLDLTISKGFNVLRTGLLSTSIYFKSTNTFSYLHGDSFIARHVLKGIAVGEIVRTLRNTSCPGYFRLIKRILIRNFYRRGFPKKAIQAAKRIGFGKRRYYLEASKQKTLLRPIPVRTKFCNFIPSVGIIFREAWFRVLDDPVLSYFFPTAPFPVWSNRKNLKNILSYKKKIFSGNRLDRKSSVFKFQKFNRPIVRRRCNTI